MYINILKHRLTIQDAGVVKDKSDKRNKGEKFI